MANLRIAMLAASMVLSSQSVLAAAGQYEQLMKEGAQHAAQREPDKAVASYSKAIESDPKNAAAYLKRAFQYCRLKKFDEAKADYDRAIRLEPKNAKTYRERGCMLGSLRRYHEAIQDFSKSIEINPKMSTPYIDRARAWQALGQPEKARKDLDTALKYYSGNENVGIKNKSVYFTYGANPNKNTSQKKLAAIGKGLCVALRGNLAGESGDLDEALQDIHDSNGMIQARPTRRSVQNSFREKGKVEKLINSYSQLIYLNPKDTDSFYNRGIIYVSLRQWDAATTNFARVVELTKWSGRAPVQASIWRVIGLYKQNKKLEAQKTVREAAAKCKDGSWPRPLLTYLEGKTSKEEILKSARGLEQKTQAHCVIGLMESAEGKNAESIKEFEWIEKNGDITLDEFVIALNELPS